MCGVFTFQGQKVFPGQNNPVITTEFNKPVDLRWGINGFQINSRLESLKSKSFLACLIATDGYYEAGHYFPIFSQKPHFFAGVHDDSAFTIITKPADDIVLPYHPRMPAVLDESLAQSWLRTGDLSLLS